MKLLEQAIFLASKGDPDRNYYLACVVKRKDGAVTYSLNERTRVPVPRSHAEARAVLKADVGAELYVARVTRTGIIGMSRPCRHCQAIIRNRGIGKVIYTIGPNECGIWYPQKDKEP